MHGCWEILIISFLCVCFFYLVSGTFLTQFTHFASLNIYNSMVILFLSSFVLERNFPEVCTSNPIQSLAFFLQPVLLPIRLLTCFQLLVMWVELYYLLYLFCPTNKISTFLFPFLNCVFQISSFYTLRIMVIWDPEVFALLMSVYLITGKFHFMQLSFPQWCKKYGLFIWFPWSEKFLGGWVGRLNFKS